MDKTTASLTNAVDVPAKSIINLVDGFAHATNEVISSADMYPELKKALVTEATENGIRVGSWEIEHRTVDGLGNFYNVIHAVTKEPIVDDIRLYEGARILVDALNAGNTINSMKVKNILAIEDEYARAISDAVHFSTRAKMTEGMQQSIAEDRYNHAKERALNAKKALRDFSKLI